MVEGLTKIVLVAALHPTEAASRLWEDRPSPPLAQAAQDAPSPGPTVRPIQLIGWDAMVALPATTEVHILTHRDTWWTVEWDDHGKVRQATARAPKDEVQRQPCGQDRLQLAARVPHTPEAASEALHHALYWARGAQGGPLPPERKPAWTRHATRYAAHMRRHGTGTRQGLLTPPRTRPAPCRRPSRRLAS